MNALKVFLIIYLKMMIICDANYIKEQNLMKSTGRARREIEYTNLVQLQAEIKELYRAVRNVTATVETNCDDKAKFKITNSYIPSERETLTFNDQLQYERIKMALILKNEEIALKDGRIIEMQKQIENLQGVQPTQQNKKDNDTVCPKELLKEMKSTYNKMEETGANKYGKIIYSVNAGGKAHVDANGIYYSEDPLEGPANKQLDWCKDIKFKRVPEEDYILYQNIRFMSSTFEYRIPLPEDGPYVMVLKFCECAARQKNHRDFNVVLNKLHIVLEHVDLYARASHGVALEEYVTFNVEKGHLEILGGKSIVNNNYTTVEFVPFNSKQIVLAAILVAKGNLENVPRLPPIYRPVY